MLVSSALSTPIWGQGGVGDVLVVDPTQPGVEDVYCFCLEEQGPGVVLQWRNPPEAQFEQIRILRDDPQNPGTLVPFPPYDPVVDPRTERLVIDQLPENRPVTLAVAVQVAEEISIPVTCTTICPHSADLNPRAVIDPATPRRIVQQIDRPVEFVLDGRQSSDAFNESSVEFFWQTDPALASRVLLLQPRSAVTRVVVRPLPANVPEVDVPIRLRVVAKGTLDRPEAEDFAQVVVRVVREARGIVELIEPIPPSEIFRRALANPPDAPDRHELRFQIALSRGAPYPAFELRDGPRGLDLDRDTGVLRWAPTIQDAGRRHDIAISIIRREDPAQRIDYRLSVDVFDPFTPATHYRFDVGADAGDPNEGGAGEGPLPATTITDRTALPLPLDLHLILPPLSEECSVFLQPAEPGAAGESRLSTGIRFEPSCAPVARNARAQGGGAGVGPPVSGLSGGYYVSPSAGVNVAESMMETDEMTVEIWLSSVSDTQPGAFFGMPAFIFSQSKGSSLFNWRIGVEEAAGADQRYVAEVMTTAGPVTVTFEDDLSDASDHQIVLTRRHDGPGGSAVHRLFLDGNEKASVVVAGALRDGVDAFDKSYPIFVGAAQGGVHPFTGTITTCGAYSEALSDSMISFLHSLGADDPEPGAIDDPTATICPDPHEIGRTRWGADGSESQPGIPVPLGFPGGGAGLDLCDEFLELLYPCEWSVTPFHPGVIIQEVTAYTKCGSQVEITVPGPDEPGVGGNRTWEVSLIVRQIGIRGEPIRVSTTATATIVVADEFQRGDTNDDGALDVSDPTRLLLWLFGALPEPPCLKAADFDNDEALGITDAQLALMYLFQQGAGPAPPSAATCGVDDGGVGETWLSCLQYNSCP